MKLSDFVLLTVKEKRHAVLSQGVVIAKIATASTVIFLFGIDNFYVETCFNAVNKDIEEFRMYDDSRLPTLYLDGIPVNELLP